MLGHLMGDVLAFCYRNTNSMGLLSRAFNVLHAQCVKLFSKTFHTETDRASIKCTNLFISIWSKDVSKAQGPLHAATDVGLK